MAHAEANAKVIEAMRAYDRAGAPLVKRGKWLKEFKLWSAPRMGRFGKHHMIMHGYKSAPNSLLLDCGACCGESGLVAAWCLKYLKRSDVKIVMLDPSPSKIDFIRATAKALGVHLMIVTRCCGLFDKTMKGHLDTTGCPSTWTVRPAAAGEDEIELFRLDDLTTVTDYRGLDVSIDKSKFCALHIDCEGTDLQVMQGAGETIRAADHPPMTVEVYTQRFKVNNELCHTYIKNVLRYHHECGPLHYDQMFHFPGSKHPRLPVLKDGEYP